MKVNNKIFVRRAKKIFISSGTSSQSNEKISTFIKNLESFGFTFSSELIDVLSTLSDEQLSDFYFETVDNLKILVGAKKKFQPMYPNFPTSVMEADEAELYLNAIRHYDSLELPDIESEPREKLTQVSNKLTQIKLGTEEEYLKMFKNLIGSGTSISESDKNDITLVLIENVSDVLNFFPETIPFKENLTFVSGLLFGLGVDVSNLTKFYNTSTDVLRFATSLSNGDVSLADNTKYKKFSRKERKFLLSLIESQKNLAEDMRRHEKKWIRLGERLHPGEFEKKFPKTFQAFKAIRNSEKIETFAGKVEEGIKSGNILEILETLKSRPGEFGRRLDSLIRKSSDVESVLLAFEQIANKLSIPMLLLLSSHFEKRNLISERAVFPKGSVAKIQVIPSAENISENICHRVSEICNKTLIEKFSKKPKLGKVFISKDIEKQIVPFSQRSASKAFKTIVRGSRIPLNDGNFVRFFIWWKNQNGNRIDVDLSASFMDSEFKHKDNISFRSLRNSYCVHSGDIVDAPDGASEFIDVDIEKAVARGIRYVCMDIRNYTGYNYSTMDECFAGFMIRQGCKSGEIYEPKEVVNKFDLTSDSNTACPLVIDLVAREMIWMDLSTGRSIVVGASNGSYPKIVKAVSEMARPTLSNLFFLHAMARGELVSTPEEADITFSMDGDVTPFDIEKIVGKYLV